MDGNVAPFSVHTAAVRCAMSPSLPNEYVAGPNDALIAVAQEGLGGQRAKIGIFLSFRVSAP
jgi:hypothetical protein